MESADMISTWGSLITEPNARRFLLAVICAVCFFALRFVLDTFIFRSLGIWMLRTGSDRLRMNKATKRKVGKCSESMWKLLYYAIVEIWVLRIIYNEPWFTDKKEYFRGWPNQELKLPISLYYLCQCGFYIYSVAALLLWDTRRKDFSVMMAHHVITVILIACSYVTRLFRIGSVILALHDASDVFLEAAKILKYSGRNIGASVCFGLFAISWLILRLILFPFWVIKSSSYDVLDFIPLSKCYTTSLYYVFNIMLIALLVFHIYWWILIWSVIKKQWENRGMVGEDVRSDSDDD